MQRPLRWFAVDLGLILLALLAGQSDAKEPARTLRVRVMTLEEVPLAGAKLQASVFTKEEFPRTRLYHSDDQGIVLVELPATFSSLSLFAFLKDHVTMTQQWSSKADQVIPAEFKLHMPKGAVIGGTIKNEQGEPIAGVRVEATSEGRPRFGGAVEAWPYPWFADKDTAAVTDAKGQWKLTNAPPFDELGISLKLKHPDYASNFTGGWSLSNWGTTEEAVRDGSAIFTMRRGRLIHGCVLDAEDRPIVGAIVIWNETNSHAPETRILTDKEGRYRLPRIWAGKTRLTVAAPNHALDSVTVLKSEENAEVNFVLAKGQPLVLRFVDVAGAPIPDVYVSLARWRDNTSLQQNDLGIPSRADKAGRYDWNWAPEGPLLFRAVAHGFEDAEFTIDDRDRERTLELLRK
jgi:hypothetical protein